MYADTACRVPASKTKTSKIMKKTYIAPSVEVIKVETTVMMATSVDLYSDSTSVDQQLGRDATGEWY